MEHVVSITSAWIPHAPGERFPSSQEAVWLRPAKTHLGADGFGS